MAPATLTTVEERTPERTLLPAVGGMVVALAALVVLVTSTVSLVREVAGGRPLTPYVAPQYWLGYDGGFLRRALPGAVLQLLSGGHAPSYTAARTMGVALSVAAVAAVVLLAVLLARWAGDWWTATTLAAVVVAGPLGLPLLARDLGRYDAIGVLVLVALTAVPWTRLPLPVVVLGSTTLTAVAVASQEFLVALVLPVALVAVWPALRGRATSRLWAAVVALPSLVLAGLSAVLPAPPAVLSSALAAARAAGVPPSVPLVPGLTDHDAVSRLAYGFVENVRTYYSILTPAGVVGSAVVWAAVYLVLVGSVWYLLGRSVRERGFVLVTACGGLAALALSVAGIDFRRWWSLAALAVLCLLLLRTGQTGPAQRTRRAERTGRAEWTRRWGRPASGGDRVVGVALIALGVTAVLLQNVPAYWTPPWWR